MDPYEKLLSPCRNARRSTRLSASKAPSISGKTFTGKQIKKNRSEAKKGEAISGVCVVLLTVVLAMVVNPVGCLLWISCCCDSEKCT